MATIVYELWHFPIDADVDFDEARDRKSIGIYSSKANAEAAIDRLKTKPGFRDWPDGFRVFEAQLDQDSWVDGYGSWDDPPEGDKPLNA
jgi:hypothetical protein